MGDILVQLRDFKIVGGSVKMGVGDHLCLLWEIYRHKAQTRG